MSIVIGEMLTFSGNRVRPMEMQLGDIYMSDIGHALSMVCRWGGHCSRFMSVAEHSVIVSMLVPEHLALAGLLHDAAEAYLGDMPAPLKHDRRFNWYRQLERTLEDKIEERFGLLLTDEDRATIKEADVISRELERQMLMPRPPSPPSLSQEDYDRVSSVILGGISKIGKPQAQAKNEFFQRFYVLTGGRL